MNFLISLLVLFHCNYRNPVVVTTLRCTSTFSSSKWKHQLSNPHSVKITKFKDLIYKNSLHSILYTKLLLIYLWNVLLFFALFCWFFSSATHRTHSCCHYLNFHYTEEPCTTGCLDTLACAALNISQSSLIFTWKLLISNQHYVFLSI